MGNICSCLRSNYYLAYYKQNTNKEQFYGNKTDIRKRKIIERVQRSGGKKLVAGMEEITKKVIQIGEQTNFGRGLLKKLADRV